MYYRDYETMIYGEDGENPLKPTVLRCIEEAANDGNRLRIELRVQHLGTTSSKSEHSFIVDAKEEHCDTIIHNIKTRLDAAPGEGFEGQVRINLYAGGNSGVKYGSFSRQIRLAEQHAGYGHASGGNGMFSQTRSPWGMDDDGGDDGYDDGGGGDAFDDAFSGHNQQNDFQQNQSFDQMQQMQSMMQMMMQQQMAGQGGGGNPGGAVDQKMAMEWLSHTMSFLFRSLALQMSMFERSTKLVETYAMRFGLPQPLEKPAAERIIREVPMELEFPEYTPPPQQPVQQEKPSLLPQLLQAASAFAGNPQAGALLQTAATMLSANQAPAQPAPPPQPVPRPRIKRKSIPEDYETGNSSGPRYMKQEPPKPKKPINGVDEWEPTQENDGSNFSFGLDGSHNQIDPFGQRNTSNMFADFEEDGDDENDFGFDIPDDNAGGGFEDDGFDDEIQMPEGMPDLTGMSPEEMKDTVINWVNADPENRKSQIMAMLPELSSLIM